MGSKAIIIALLIMIYYKNFMLIIKKTPFIETLYQNKGLRIIEEDKTYFVSFKNRNKKDVKHLIIMNY